MTPALMAEPSDVATENAAVTALFESHPDPRKIGEKCVPSTAPQRGGRSRFSASYTSPTKAMTRTNAAKRAMHGRLPIVDPIGQNRALSAMMATLHGSLRCAALGFMVHGRVEPSERSEVNTRVSHYIRAQHVPKVTAVSAAQRYIRRELFV